LPPDVDPGSRDAAARTELRARRGIRHGLLAGARFEQALERTQAVDTPFVDDSIEQLEIVAQHVEYVDLARASAGIDGRDAEAHCILLRARALRRRNALALGDGEVG